MNSSRNTAGQPETPCLSPDGNRLALTATYLYAEHLFPHAEPSQNARAIRTLGDWIPGVINFSGLRGSQAEKDKIRQIYRELGLNIQSSNRQERRSR